MSPTVKRLASVWTLIKKGQPYRKTRRTAISHLQPHLCKQMTWQLYIDVDFAFSGNSKAL